MSTSFIGGFTETVDTWDDGNHHVAVVIDQLDEIDLDGVTLGTPYVMVDEECESMADLDPSQARSLGAFLQTALSAAADRLEEILATRDTIA